MVSSYIYIYILSEFKYDMILTQVIIVEWLGVYKSRGHFVFFFVHVCTGLFLWFRLVFFSSSFVWIFEYFPVTIASNILTTVCYQKKKKKKEPMD